MKMETDEQKTHYALSLWANYIETGSITLGGKGCAKTREGI
jgi:hypothetical protein